MPGFVVVFKLQLFPALLDGSPPVSDLDKLLHTSFLGKHTIRVVEPLQLLQVALDVLDLFDVYSKLLSFFEQGLALVDAPAVVQRVLGPFLPLEALGKPLRDELNLPFGLFLVRLSCHQNLFGRRHADTLDQVLEVLNGRQLLHPRLRTVAVLVLLWLRVLRVGELCVCHLPRRCYFQALEQALQRLLLPRVPCAAEALH
mmetsp:Transcript_4775/g.8693  ORF Transcript_4775/g.8693 Transcript_4775/m.8693 type:complete len:200 (-) Transcript_4775:114-713(-)